MKKNILIMLLILLSFNLSAFKYSKFYCNGCYGFIDENRNIVLLPEYEYLFIYDDLCIVAKKKDGDLFLSVDRLKPIIELPEKTRIKERTARYEFRIHIYGEKEDQIFNVMDGKIKDIKNNDYLHEYEWSCNSKVMLSHYDDKKKTFSFTVVDDKNEIVFDNIRQTDCSYSEGLLPVVLFDGKSGYINSKGEFEIVTKLFEDDRMGGIRIEPLLNYPFGDEIALVQVEKDKWFFLSKSGDMKPFPFEYRKVAGIYKEGLIVVMDGKQKLGYLNKKAELEIPCMFEKAYNFVGKYASVVYNGKDAVIDKQGNIYYCEDFTYKTK